MIPKDHFFRNLILIFTVVGLRAVVGPKVLPYFFLEQIIKIFHGWEERIEKSVPRSLFGRVMPNSDPKGWYFLSAPDNHDRFFFLHTLWSPAFDFNVGDEINESHSYTLTSAILKVDLLYDVALTSSPNVL